MQRSLLILISLVYIFAAAALPVLADNTAEVDARTTVLYDSVMSPYCPAVTLSACTSPNAKALRDEIRGWVEGGKNDEEIQALLVDQFGTGVLGVPTSSGFGLVGWFAPAVVVVLGLILLAVVLRRMQADNGQVVEGQPEIDPEMQKRIDAELEKRLV